MQARAVILSAALVISLGASAAAQDRYNARGPEPQPGTVAIGGSLGAAPPDDPSFTTGLALSGDIEDYVSRRLAIRGQLSGAWWDITGRGFTGTTQPIAAEANVVYDLGRRRAHPYITGGVGLYHYRFDETPTTGGANKPGVDFGAGMNYFVHRRTAVTGEVLYHAVSEPVASPLTVFNSNAYWTVTVGLRSFF